jgi:hypothetical protein
MNKAWRNIGIIALAAGFLYYPVMKMYKEANGKKKADGHEKDTDPKVLKDKTDKGNSGGNTNNMHGTA